jgi:hypothetical protein
LLRIAKHARDVRRSTSIHACAFSSSASHVLCGVKSTRRSASCAPFSIRGPHQERFLFS